MLLIGLKTVVKNAVDTIGRFGTDSSENKRRIVGLRLKQAEMLCALFQYVVL